MINTQNNITYTDDEKLKVVFTTLIINVKSLNTKYGNISEFAKNYDLYGVTNGKIWVLSEMVEPPIILESIISGPLKKYGFIEGIDYLLCIEYLVNGARDYVSPLLNKEIPECQNTNWLEGKILSNGNYVWLKDKNYLSDCSNVTQALQTILTSYFQKINPYKLQYEPKALYVKRGGLFFQFNNQKSISNLGLNHLIEYCEFSK